MTQHRVRSVRLFDARGIGIRQLGVEAGDQLFELRKLGDADDGRRDRRLAENPGKRHLNRRDAEIARDLRAYRAAGCSHVALEVSYSTYPAIMETLDIVVEEILPALAQR